MQSSGENGITHFALQALVTDIFLLKNSADPDSLAFARSVSELQFNSAPFVG